MSSAHERCPHCEAEFRGEANPRNVGENAFLKVRTHVWMRHSEKTFICPTQTGAVKNDFWRSNGTCSYCGSIDADEFFKAIEAGTELVPTDKDYKVYVGKDQIREFKFAHFRKEQMEEFIEIYNSRLLNMPELFYVLPFFMRAA